MHYNVNVRLTLFIPFQIGNSTNGPKNNATGKLWVQFSITGMWQKLKLINWIHYPNENYQIKWKTTSLSVGRRESLVRHFKIHQSNISLLWQIFYKNGPTQDRHRLRITTPVQYLYIRVFNLIRDSTITVTDTAKYITD